MIQTRGVAHIVYVHYMFNLWTLKGSKSRKGHMFMFKKDPILANMLPIWLECVNGLFIVTVLLLYRIATTSG